MQIDVFSDPICPWCFIGKKRLEAARALRPDTDVNIRWRAFQLNPDMPPEGMDRADYLRIKFGGSTRAQEIYAHIGRIGDEVGIPFDFARIPRTPNTLAAHGLIRYAQTEEPARTDVLMDALFHAYFLGGRDIGEADVLTDIAGEVGLDTAAVAARLAESAYVEEIRAEDEYARRLGIAGVPCFIVAGKYALSGAQEPESFLPLFDMARQESAEAAASPRG